MDTRKKMVSLEVLDKLVAELRAMPAYVPTHVSKQGAITMLADAIAEMREKGYRWNDVAAWLTDNGLAVSAGALRTYVRRAAESTALARGKVRGKRATDVGSGLGARSDASTKVVRLVAVGEPTPREPNDRRS